MRWRLHLRTERRLGFGEGLSPTGQSGGKASCRRRCGGRAWSMELMLMLILKRCSSVWRRYLAWIRACCGGTSPPSAPPPKLPPKPLPLMPPPQARTSLTPHLRTGFCSLELQIARPDARMTSLEGRRHRTVGKRRCTEERGDRVQYRLAAGPTNLPTLQRPSVPIGYLTAYLPDYLAILPTKYPPRRQREYRCLGTSTSDGAGGSGRGPRACCRAQTSTRPIWRSR
mmetsp:Transcript_6115/g.13365  ORF Transcript_6115/g.13365 Transcript_6115/m.13365 type:complete len:227 (-) Transcript_6115:322-1002(-)